MALNLLQLCTRALDELSSFNVPNFIIGNPDDIAKTLLAAAFKVGEELVRDYDWNEMSRTATVSTVISTTLYDLEEDYDRLAPDTMWNATEYRRMFGPTTRRQWAAITNSQVDPALTHYWRLFGGRIQVDPVPASVFTFSYEYLSKVYCRSSGGADLVDGWVNDTDVPVLPGDIFIHGIRYYFSEAKTLPGSLKAAAEYDAVIQSRQNKNVPGEAVNMAAGVRTPGTDLRSLNIPDRIDT